MPSEAASKSLPLGPSPVAVILFALLCWSPTAAAEGDLSVRSPAQLEASIERLAGSTSFLPATAPRELEARSCGTADLLDLHLGWDELADDQRDRVRRAIGPEEADGAGEGSERGVVPCFFNLANSVESEHFSIQWGPNGNTTTATAEALLEALETTRTTFLDGGYAQPLGNPDFRVPFYLGNSGGGAPSISFSGGYATTCAEYQHAYVVLSSISADNGGIDVSNHELFHAVQMGSPSPYDVDSYYWEASAVWSEEFAEPTFNLYAWFLYAYTDHTEWPLDLTSNGSSEGFLHKYAMFILPIYIEEWAPEGLGVLLDVWNASGGSVIQRMNASWEERGYSTWFARQFGHFTSHVSTLDFEDRGAYLGNAVSARELLEPPEELEEDIEPGTFGSHFYEVSTDAAEGSNTKLLVEFEGDEDWVIALNRSENGITAFSKVVLSDEEGRAELEGIDLGTRYEEVWVIVTNAPGSSGDYRLSVELVEQTEPAGSDRPDYEPPPGPAGGGQGCSECAENKGGAHPFSYGAGRGLIAILPLLFLCRRLR
ncbi:MAG: hypothetical protein VX498_08660 [Myxococcota bacterium]|nr:hypothetical protein [Myxococcota bacterium]